MGRMTPLLRRLHTLAKKHHLPNALGRAIVLTNRHYNTGAVGWGGDPRSVSGLKEDTKAEVAYMKNLNPERALRWLKHWSEGGSLKSLKYSHEKFLERRRWEAAMYSKF